jgi:hypothetical protein
MATWLIDRSRTARRVELAAVSEVRLARLDVVTDDARGRASEW